MERPKSFYAFMPPELKLNLFDLHEENNDIEQTNVNFKDFTNIMDNFLINIASSFDNDIFSEESMENMFNNIMSKVENKETHVPTIDELLEKIKDKGLESLTDNEKQILDEYSKS
jgi:predicted transcriptional regulator